MMWASLLLAGILSGWWGAFALAAAPPANSALAGSTGGGDSSDVISSAAITPSSVRHVGDSSTSAMTTPARTDDFRGFEPATSPPPPTSPRATDAVHDVFSLDRIHPRDTWKTERRSQTQIARTVEATERGDDFPTKLAENRSDDFSPAAENRDDSVERIGGDDFTPDPAENRDTSLDRRRGENRNADFSPAAENLDERIGGEDFTPDPAENRDTSEDQRRGENSSAKVAFSIGPLLENFAGYQVTPTSVRREIRNGDHDEGRDSLASSAEASSDDTSFEDLTELQDYSLDDEEWPRKSDTGKVVAGDSLYPSLGAENSPTSSASTATLWAEVFGPGTDQRTRVSRSTKQQQQQQQKQQQRAANRTRSDSAREQRRKCRNKGCRGRNWCPDMDIGNRAFLAPTVFEGKARSMSSLRKPGSNYAVTFEVKQVYKSQPSFQPLQKNDSVRLHFRDKAAPGKSTLCGNAGQQQQQQRDSPGGVVRANIKRGKVYLVFVNRVGPRNFTILGEPVIRSKKNEQAVQAVIRPDYVRQVTLSELRDSVARLRDRVKLVCRTRGSPPPRVHWLKDGVPLHPRRGLRIQHKRRRSKVVIASARQEDSGRYECVAESTSGHRASLTAQLLVDRDTRVQDTTTAAWPRQEQPCPIAGDFCMNGGTCLFFETVGEPACRCAEGFTGLRCETKDVISTGSVYNRHRAPFSCKLGLSTSYYC